MICISSLVMTRDSENRWENRNPQKPRSVAAEKKGVAFQWDRMHGKYTEWALCVQLVQNKDSKKKKKRRHCYNKSLSCPHIRGSKCSLLASMFSCHLPPVQPNLPLCWPKLLNLPVTQTYSNSLNSPLCFVMAPLHMLHPLFHMHSSTIIQSIFTVLVDLTRKITSFKKFHGLFLWGKMIHGILL